MVSPRNARRGRQFVHRDRNSPSAETMDAVRARAFPLVLLLATASAACTEPESSQVVMLVAADGDGQVGPAGTLLPSPIVATVLDAGGGPLPGRRINWQAAGDDRLIPVDAVTDGAGQARASWLLGSAAGTRRATATLRGATPAVFTATATPGRRGSEALPFDVLIPLDFATYDGSHQVVHPDFVATPGRSAGPPLHLAITPYPFGNAAYENPSLFESTRRDAWSVSPGTPEPIQLPHEGYLSDPDVVYLPERDELWLYYRQVVADNVVLLTRSHDGREWSAPVEVVRAPNHQIVSPSVTRRAPDDWWMYAVNSGAVGCGAASTRLEVRRSSDGIHWGAPGSVELPSADLWPWHVDVQWIPSRGVFWALYNAKDPNGCTTPAAYIAESADGLVWNVAARPVLSKGAIPTLQDIVYRGTFEFDSDADAITFWFSGARYDGGQYVWGAAVERRHRADVFAPAEQLERPAAPPSPAPAPLIDWP
jgi:hypothetical protein